MKVNFSKEMKEDKREEREREREGERETLGSYLRQVMKRSGGENTEEEEE